MSDLEDEEQIGPTLMYKVPFFLLGVLLGMCVVWVALQWVPGAAAPALRAIAAG